MLFIGVRRDQRSKISLSTLLCQPVVASSMRYDIEYSAVGALSLPELPLDINKV